MSLVTRIFGFGLCLLGAFAIGYYEGVHSAADSVVGVVSNVTGSIPNFGPPVIAQVTTYLQQTVTSTLDTYLAIGLVMAIGGIFLIARGDPKPKTAQKSDVHTSP